MSEFSSDPIVFTFAYSSNICYMPKCAKNSSRQGTKQGKIPLFTELTSSESKQVTCKQVKHGVR